MLLFFFCQWNLFEFDFSVCYPKLNYKTAFLEWRRNERSFPSSSITRTPMATIYHSNKNRCACNFDILFWLDEYQSHAFRVFFFSFSLFEWIKTKHSIDDRIWIFFGVDFFFACYTYAFGSKWREEDKGYSICLSLGAYVFGVHKSICLHTLSEKINAHRYLSTVLFRHTEPIQVCRVREKKIIWQITHQYRRHAQEDHSTGILNRSKAHFSMIEHEEHIWEIESLFPCRCRSR